MLLYQVYTIQYCNWYALPRRSCSALIGCRAVLLYCAVPGTTTAGTGTWYEQQQWCVLIPLFTRYSSYEIPGQRFSRVFTYEAGVVYSIQTHTITLVRREFFAEENRQLWKCIPVVVLVWSTYKIYTTDLLQQQGSIIPNISGPPSQRKALYCLQAIQNRLVALYDLTHTYIYISDFR